MSDLIRDTLCMIDSSYRALEIHPVDGLPGESSGGRTGLDLVVERRAQLDRQAVVLYGFDSAERVKERSHGAILKAPGVFYLKLPATLEQVYTVFKKAKNYKKVDYNKAEKAVTHRYALQQLRAFKHRCDNLWMSMQSNIGRVKKGRNGQIPALFGGSVNLAYMEKFASEYKMIENLAVQTGLKGAEQIPLLFADILKSMRRLAMITESTVLDEKKAILTDCVRSIKAISNILSAAKEIEERV